VQGSGMLEDFSNDFERYFIVLCKRIILQRRRMGEVKTMRDINEKKQPQQLVDLDQ
jgi:hypothetical protein